MKTITLIKPQAELKEEILAFKNAFFEAGENTIDGCELLDRMDSFEEWLAYVTDNAQRQNVRKGCVLTDTFLAVNEQNDIVGIIDLRYELNDFFKDFGHSGYSVLPSQRRKGYATEMLSQVKTIAKEAGLTRIQLAALESNIPSVKTILNNGGELNRSFDFYGHKALVYLIEL